MKSPETTALELAYAMRDSPEFFTLFDLHPNGRVTIKGSHKATLEGLLKLLECPILPEVWADYAPQIDWLLRVLEQRGAIAADLSCYHADCKERGRLMAGTN